MTTEWVDIVHPQLSPARVTRRAFEGAWRQRGWTQAGSVSRPEDEATMTTTSPESSTPTANSSPADEQEE